MKKLLLFMLVFFMIILISVDCSKKSQSTTPNTPVATATPVGGTISGNIILPAAELGVTWQVLVDTDMNFNNGITNMVVGICPLGATSIPYSVTAPAGTYYVYALVKTAGALTSPPIAGDLLGWDGALYPASPSSAGVILNSQQQLAGQNITMVAATSNVSGTITMPANANGLPIILIISPTTNPAVAEFYVNVTPVAGMTGTTYNYSTLCYMPGSFYITAQVSGDGSGLPRPPKTGDYVGQSVQETMDPTLSNGPYNFSLTTF